MPNIINKKKIILFLISAVLTGSIYIGILYLLRDVWNLHPFLSVTAAYICAMAFYFLSNKLIVFKKISPQKNNVIQQLFPFIIMLIINFSITLFLVWLFMRFTGEVYSGSVAAGIITTLLAFLVFNKIFK